MLPRRFGRRRGDGLSRVHRRRLGGKAIEIQIA
jgi:hypothetical protein